MYVLLLFHSQTNSQLFLFTRLLFQDLEKLEEMKQKKAVEKQKKLDRAIETERRRVDKILENQRAFEEAKRILGRHQRRDRDTIKPC